MVQIWCILRKTFEYSIMYFEASIKACTNLTSANLYIRTNSHILLSLSMGLRDCNCEDSKSLQSMITCLQNLKFSAHMRHALLPFTLVEQTLSISAWDVHQNSPQGKNTGKVKEINLLPD